MAELAAKGKSAAAEREVRGKPETTSPKINRSAELGRVQR